MNADHVVIGAGPLGLAVSRALRRRGRKVRIVTGSGRAEVPGDVDVVAADVADGAQAARACQGASVVFHCTAGPIAGWARMCEPLMRGVIAGAAAPGAKVVYGDNLYAYGPASGPIREDLPARASGPVGAVRRRAAALLLDAHAQGKVRATIGRASDFYGSYVWVSSLGARVFLRALEGRPAQVLGDPDLPHTYTFVDDFAEALVTLSEREESLGQVWHVPSAETVTTRQFVQMVFEEAGTPPRLAVAPGWVITLAGLLNPTLRAVKEQSYQRTRPWVVDHSKFAKVFGAAATPHREAIRQTVGWFRDYRAGTSG